MARIAVRARLTTHAWVVFTLFVTAGCVNLMPGTTAITSISERDRAYLYKQLTLVGRVSFERTQAKLSKEKLDRLLREANDKALPSRDKAVDASDSALVSRGGGIVSDSGAGLVAKGGGMTNTVGAYRLTETIAPISTDAAGDERLFSYQWFAPEERCYVFTKRNGSYENFGRRVDVFDSGLRFQQTRSALKGHDNGVTAEGIDHLFAQDRMGQVLQDSLTRYTRDEKGNITSVKLMRPAIFRIPSGPEIQVDTYELDYLGASGKFVYRFVNSGLREEGTVNSVDAGFRTFTINDPLWNLGGESVLTDASGHVVAKKTVVREGGQWVRSFELGQELSLRLEAWAAKWTVTLNGKKIGTADFTPLSDDTLVVTVSLLDKPNERKYLAFGNTNDIEARMARLEANEPLSVGVRPPSTWRVFTIAGREAGFKDGDEETARFKDLRNLVASRVVPGRFYATELGNHRIIQFEPVIEYTIDGVRNGWQFKTVAGTGTEGDRNGAGRQASFRGPRGLAIGPDDTLYVAESLGNRLRVLRRNPNDTWQVDTLAGDATAGFADGAGTDARFNTPLGLVLQGANLFVADGQNHRIRRIDLTRNPALVTSVAGNGVPGYQNGLGLTLPHGLKVKDERTLLVLDELGSLRELDTETMTMSSLLGPTLNSPDDSTEVGAVDGPAAQSRVLSSFIGLVRGGILIGTGTVRVFDGEKVTTLAGGLEPKPDWLGADGSDRSAYFDDIRDAVPVEASHNGAQAPILITDQHRIRLLIPPGRNDGLGKWVPNRFVEELNQEFYYVQPGAR